MITVAMATALAPPGPKGHFVLGNLPEFSRDPLGFLEMCAREYGDVVFLRVAGVDSFVLNHPDYIDEVLVANARNFHKNRTTRMRPLNLLLGNGLVSSEGDFWKRQRRLAQPAFHRDRIAAYADAMTGFTERMLDRWQNGETKDIHRGMMGLTLEIVAKTLFGADVAGVAEEVGAALEVAMDRMSGQNTWIRLIDNYVPTPGRYRFERAVKRLDKVIYEIIRQRRASGDDQGDLLSMLLAAQDEDGSQMTDRQLRDEVMTLFLAGHETTALTLSWTWHLLAKHPEIEAALLSELQSVLGGRTPTIGDLGQLRYTEKIIKESMRLYPPAWSIGREALTDCKIGGYHVAAGTQVFMIQWTMHRDPRYFASPDQFDPDRWDNDFEKTIPKYAYFPFGGGPRQCIGNSFAMMEAMLLLAAIAQRAKLEAAPGPAVVPAPSVTLRPKNGITMTIQKR